MPTPAKALVVTIVSAVTFAFSAAPANALSEPNESHAEAAIVPVSAQSLSANANTVETKSLDSLLALSDYAEFPHNYDVEAAIAAAKSEIGTSRRTGWGQPGECIMSVKRWVQGAGGAEWTGSGSPVANYIGALRLNLDLAKAGDIVQYEHIAYPNSWVSGVHTVLITGVNDDGTFEIIESNIPQGSGLVREVSNWTPEPPSGFQAVVWRF